MALVTRFMIVHLLFTYLSFIMSEDTAFKCVIFLEIKKNPFALVRSDTVSCDKYIKLTD